MEVAVSYFPFQRRRDGETRQRDAAELPSWMARREKAEPIKPQKRRHLDMADPRSVFSPQTSSALIMLALLLLPAERFALSPCAAAFPVRHALLRCSEDEAAGALSRAQNLESLLSLAVQTERYEEAARLRDELASLGVDTELAVLEANNQFYRSFSDADLQARVAAHACALALRTLPVHTQALSPSNRPGTPPLHTCSAYAVRVRCLRSPLSQAMGELWALHHFGLQPPVHGCRRWTSCGLPKAWSRARTRATPRSTGGRRSWPRGSPSSARVRGSAVEP